MHKKEKTGFPLLSSYRGKMLIAAMFPVLLLMIASLAYMSVTVRNILQQNFEKDLGLYLSQVDDNFSKQLSTLYNLNMLLVSDEQLTADLKADPLTPGTYEAAAQKIRLEEQLENSAIVTTYSLATVDSGSLLERFYLFRDQDTCFKAMFRNRGAYENDFDHFFLERYKEHIFEGENSQMGLTDGILWYAFDFTDPDTDRVLGTLLYHINAEVLREIPDSIMEYDGAIWQISTDDGELLLSNQDSALIPAASGDGTISEQTVSNTRYLASHYHISQFGLTLSLLVPQAQTQLAAARSTTVYVLILLALAVLVLAICAAIVYKVTTPFNDLVQSIGRIEQGDLQAKLPQYKDMEFQELSHVFNSMTTKIDHLVNDVYQKQLLVTEAELKSLQAQMNPHFMFNVLNTISIQAQMDGNENISQMVCTLSQLMQASISKNGTEKVTLSQELEYAKFYVALQNARFDGKIEYQVNCAVPSLLDCYIPKLTLQPLIENAVVHGLEPKYGEGHLAVNIYADASSIYIDVLDDGVGFTPDQVDLELSEDAPAQPGHKRIGLVNSHKIIRHFYGLGYGINVISSPGNGCRVSLHIPIDRPVKGEKNPCTESPL